MNIAVIFPGQGSQTTQMLSDLYQSDLETKELFEQANDILGYNLRNIIDNEDVKLNQTSFTQPALFVTSFALWQKLKQKINPTVLAGHSLGEYNALLASEVFDFESGLKLVQKRANLMAESSKDRQGAMAAVLGLDAQKIIEICKEFNGKVSAANFNSLDQTVIAGEINAVSSCSEKLKQIGAKRVIALSVSVASHCFLMQPASEKLFEFMKNFEFKTPKINVIHNADCKSFEKSDEIKTALTKQLYQSVYWHQTMEVFNSNKINMVIECGPNRVLSNLAKKTNFFENVLSINSQKTLEDFLTLNL